MHFRTRMRRSLTVPLLFLLAAVAPAQIRTKMSPPGVITETVEWTWAQRPVAPKPALPNVLLLGDSIARGYYPEVTQKLAGRANCYLFATSAASGDPRLAGQLRAYFHMVGVRFQVIHFNNGMHGWGYTDAQYAAGLPGLLADLRQDAPGAKLIWASTTPVQNNSRTGGASNARIQVRNAAAAKLMRARRIPIDDQYTLMAGHSNLHNGDVHYTAAGSAVQADQVAQSILSMLPGR